MAATLWKVVFALDLVLLVLLAVSFPAQEPGSAARSVTYISLGIILVTLAGLAAVIRADWDPF